MNHSNIVWALVAAVVFINVLLVDLCLSKSIAGRTGCILGGLTIAIFELLTRAVSIAFWITIAVSLVFIFLPLKRSR